MKTEWLPELTPEEIANIERQGKERVEMNAAIKILKQRARRDAEMLVLLEMGLNYNTRAGQYARSGALEAARAINGEES